jgi:hypothetical protein
MPTAIRLGQLPVDRVEVWYKLFVEFGNEALSECATKYVLHVLHANCSQAGLNNKKRGILCPKVE